MKKAIIATVLVLTCIASAFAAAGSESKNTETVTIWHSAQGAAKDVFESYEGVYFSTVARDVVTVWP